MNSEQVKEETRKHLEHEAALDWLTDDFLERVKPQIASAKQVDARDCTRRRTRIVVRLDGLWYWGEQGCDGEQLTHQANFINSRVIGRCENGTPTDLFEVWLPGC